MARDRQKKVSLLVQVRPSPKKNAVGTHATALFFSEGLETYAFTNYIIGTFSMA